MGHINLPVSHTHTHYMFSSLAKKQLGPTEYGVTMATASIGVALLSRQ